MLFYDSFCIYPCNCYVQFRGEKKVICICFNARPDQVKHKGVVYSFKCRKFKNDRLQIHYDIT